MIINNTIESGENQAILTLANGEQVTLNKEKNYEQKNVKSSIGQLAYTNVQEQQKNKI